MVHVLNKRFPEQKERTVKTQQVLARLKQESEEEQAESRAQRYGLLYADLHLLPINGEDVQALPEKSARAYNAAVFQKTGRSVRIALLDPTQKNLADFLTKLEEKNGWNIMLYVVSRPSLKKVFAAYKQTYLLRLEDPYAIALSSEDLSAFEKEMRSLMKLQERITELPTTEVIDTILAGALKMEASDIHLEPQKDALRLRYRIDGVLQDIMTLPQSVYRLMLSRFKVMGKMKINIRDQAQDGHFSITVNKSLVDIRISIIPGNYNESIVMRLLRQTDAILDPQELGLRGHAYDLLQKEIMKSDGMILTTGPTGSGKTTTLYALIHRINTPDVKIITIEDPIEYELKGITQTQVAKEHGYTFAKGLRAIVRQDPDVILVGEIRDDETADIAINAALTGHIVLSTLHTNNAAASTPRLLELGVKPSLIPPAVNVFLAQRLVRRLCECKERYIPAQSTVAIIQKLLSVISPRAEVDIPQKIPYLYRPTGCKKCHALGYKGRIGIFEVLPMTEDIEKLVNAMASENDLLRAAIEGGMVTMTQDGILKAVEGLTSMEEVWRVTSQGDFLEEFYDQILSQSLSRGITLPSTLLGRVEKDATTPARLQKILDTVSAEEFFPLILSAALFFHAGDIHLEPEEKIIIVRFRIDGVLHNVARLPLVEYPALLARVKLLCGLKADRTHGVKDSRFSITLEKPLSEVTEKKVDVRVSIVLGGFGETVVLRLLHRSASTLDITSLGIREQNLTKLLAAVERPHGIVLNTGPVGSGKTTTLYNLLKKLNIPERKIITVEDPIEYQLDGILQTQVNDAENYTFATALRTLLRQDPNILMIGEIRDKEAAEIAIRAALTGHLVLSTLHTNSAVASIQRLRNMDIRGDELATAANAFMAQRLVRQLCRCKREEPPSPASKETIVKVLQTISKNSGLTIPPLAMLYAPVGCDLCRGVGYKGRTVISEILEVDAEIERLIASNARDAEITAIALERGMLTMAQDGVVKVVEGITTLEEIQRVTEL